MRERLFLLFASIVLAAGIWAAWPALASPVIDRLRYLETAALLATGVVVLLYTFETRDLRIATERQLVEGKTNALTGARAAVRPILLADVAGGSLRLTNVGLGAAIDVEVEMDPLPSGMVSSSGTGWRVQFPRVEALSPVPQGERQVHATIYRVDESGRRVGLEPPDNPSTILSLLPNRLTEFQVLPVRVTYADGYQQRTRVHFEFRAGDQFARVVRSEELGQ